MCVLFTQRDLFGTGKLYLRCSALNKRTRVSSLLEQSANHDRRHVSKRPARTRIIILSVISLHAVITAPSGPSLSRHCMPTVTTPPTKPDAPECQGHGWAATPLLCPWPMRFFQSYTPKGNDQWKMIPFPTRGFRKTKILKIQNYFLNHHHSFVIN